MADLRIPAAPPATPPARATPTARAEAVRAAQRAFFETALAGETAAPTAPTVAAASTAATAAKPVPEVRVALDPGGAPPARLLRPGSLLDIKV